MKAVALDRRARERGNVLVISFLLVTLMTALATAHFAVVQKNTRQSNFLGDLGEMRRQAEAGVHLAVHELTYNVGGSDGNIGTELWTPANDLGRDGSAVTNDEGELDGIPTPGEPNLNAAAIGQDTLLVWTTDTAWANVKRIVSTASNATSMATVEVYVREAVNAVPHVGAVYVQPGVVLDLNGNSFLISGVDKNPDGTVGPSPTVYGISTAIGSPPGSNATTLKSQVPAARTDQIVGIGSNPSIGETGSMDFDALFNAFKAARSNVVTPGTYSNVTWGDYQANDYKVTYCNGDLHLSGNGEGAGVLVVEGSVIISGKFKFVGVVIVRGDLSLTGGGSGIHIYGSAIIGETLTAIDPDPELGLAGQADIIYSSAALTNASALLGSSYTKLYWHYLK